MRIVVIGGDAAGATAASTIKRAHRDWEVIVFEKGDWTSYAACGFPFAIGGRVKPFEKIVARSPEEHRKRGLDLRTATEVTAIDTASRKVIWTEKGSGKTGETGFDRLVIATGARAKCPGILGIEHAHVLHGVENALALDRALSSVKHAVVAGAGYIALEIAEALISRKIETVLIVRSDRVMRTLDPDMAAVVIEKLKAAGIDVRLETPITGIEPASAGYTVRTASGQIDTDLVVAGLGATPVTELATAAGIPLGATGAIRVDHRQETPIEGIYAAGDCSETWHRVKEEWVNLHLGTLANKTGRVAGLNIAGREIRFPGALGTAISGFLDLEMARTGLNETEARDAGFSFKAAKIEARTRSHYFPGAQAIFVKLLVQEGTGRLLGGQIVGGAGAGKRIDTIAAALTAELRAVDLVDMDLAYAPPFSPVWDPVQIAARQLV